MHDLRPSTFIALTLLVTAVSCDRATTPDAKTDAKTAAPQPEVSTPTAPATPTAPEAAIANAAPPACPAGAKPGASGHSADLRTAGGLVYEVTTPPTYDPSVAHPLLIMHPGNLENDDSFAAQTGATPAAIAAGYVIVFANHISPLDDAAVADAATLPDAIAARWCIDPKRVFLAGNSDGATVISINVANGRIHPAAILLNAVGTPGDSLRTQDCPDPLSVLVSHGADDQLFPVPRYGIEVSEYWAGCASCQPSNEVPTDACVEHEGCAAGLAVEYCQVSLPHGRWPTLVPSFADFNSRMIAFFDAHAAVGKPSTRG